MQDGRFTYGFWSSTRWAAFAAIAAITAGLATIYLYGLIIGAPRAKPPDEYVVLVSCIAMIAVIVWGVTETRWPIRTYLALLPAPTIYIALAIAAEVAIVLFEGLVLSQLCDGSSDFETQHKEIQAAMNSPLAALFLFNTIILAPVTEEIVFRGFLLPSWSKSWLGPAGAIVATSAIFGAMHIQYEWCGMIAVGLAGVIYGWLRWRSGSLLPPIVAHCLGNAVSTIGFAAGL